MFTRSTANFWFDVASSAGDSGRTGRAATALNTFVNQLFPWRVATVPAQGGVAIAPSLDNDRFLGELRYDLSRRLVTVN